MGHSDIECQNPVPRNEDGKLSSDVQLRALEERSRRFQPFAEAAVESHRSGSSLGSWSPRAFQG